MPKYMKMDPIFAPPQAPGQVCSRVHATRIHHLLRVHVLDRAPLEVVGKLAAICGRELCQLTAWSPVGDRARMLSCAPYMIGRPEKTGDDRRLVS